MKNSKLLGEKIDDALTYLNEQEIKLKPCIDLLQIAMQNKLKVEELTIDQIFNMYCKLQDQYTNSILLLTKLKEITQEIQC